MIPRRLLWLVAPTVPLAAVALCASTSSLAAQEASGAGLGDCLLTWEPVDFITRSVTNRDENGAHVTHLKGRYLWTCGSATMEADSAVKRDGPRKVEMFKRVVYRDTIRTLRARRLSYFQNTDLIIAEEDVELTRLADSSTLVGPRVEFLRALSGFDALTTATGRPTVTFHPTEGESREPFVVQSDVAIFAGEDEARFHGNAVISRSDLRAEADSAYLTRTEQRGVMWGGTPWIEAEQIRLEGDTIRFRSEREALEEVRATGAAYASGERFNVRSEVIDIALEDQRVEAVWAHGDGIGEAVSAGHQVFGDSLYFAMHENQIDTLYAVGEAIAIQRDSTMNFDLGASGSATATPAEIADFGGGPASVGGIDPGSGAASGIEAAPAGEGGGSEEGGNSAAGDDVGEGGGSERSGEAGSGGDSAEGGDSGESGGSAEAGDSGEGGDSAAGDDAERGGDSGAGSRPPRVQAPELTVDGTANWATGDTLVAAFERTAKPTPADTAQAAPRMSNLRLAGNARALYLLVRDSLATPRPSLNYLKGTDIEVKFREGAPHAVAGANAVGVYLEPHEAFGVPPQPDSPPADSLRSDSVRADSLATGNRGAPTGDSGTRPVATGETATGTLSAPRDTLQAAPAPPSAPGRRRVGHEPPPKSAVRRPSAP